MVQTTYDIFNRQESPEFTLCNPNGEELYSLKSATRKEVIRRFNAISELTITIPREVNDVVVPAYVHLKQKRLVLVDDNESGYFVITDVTEDSRGDIPSKTITALSYDYNLVSKKLFAFGGTYPLYDVLDPASSLLGVIVALAPSWTIGAVDSELLTRFRTFDVADTNIYEFLVTNVEEAYNCIILFDNINKVISARTLDNVTTETDVWMSHDNLINSSSFREISDELNTALYVTGGGDLSINAVNPLGTNVIYNFDYYKSTDWMTQALIDAIDDWEAVIAANQTAYANTLTSVKVANAELIVLNGELTALESELLALELLLKVRVEGNLSTADIAAQIQTKEIQIASKENEITNKTSEISSFQTTLDNINTAVSFNSNFTASELVQLDFFINENTYSNENIAQLDTDTAVEVQTLAQTLYDQGVEVLARVSQPRFEFDTDNANMLSLKEFESLNLQLELGSIIHMENASSQELSLILLEMTFDYMSPGKFSITFSNRLRLDNGSFIYSDLLGQAVKTGTKVDLDSVKWANWANNYKNDVTTFINSSLDASANAVINAENQEILINATGLRGRKWDGVSGYEGTEVWLTSNVIAFTEDSWATSSAALGNITHNGSPQYGLVADNIVGRMIAGNTLSIENDNNNFLLNEQGAFLTDASFVMESGDEKSKITLDPSLGIKIQTRANPSVGYNDTFYVDASSGNIIFSGELSGAEGSFSGSITAEEGLIGGMEITSEGINVDTTHYIHNDGEIKWGGLWLKTNGDAQFDGDIYAGNIVGSVDWSQIVNVPIPTSQFNGGSGYSAGGITTGNMSGSRVFGGVIGWDGVQLYTSGFGEHFISAQTYLNILTPGVGFSGQIVVEGFSSLNGGASIHGNLFIDGIAGRTQTVTVDTPFGTRFLGFRDGIFITYTS